MAALQGPHRNTATVVDQHSPLHIRNLGRRDHVRRDSDGHARAMPAFRYCVNARRRWVGPESSTEAHDQLRVDNDSQPLVSSQSSC